MAVTHLQSRPSSSFRAGSALDAHKTKFTHCVGKLILFFLVLSFPICGVPAEGHFTIRKNKITVNAQLKYIIIEKRVIMCTIILVFSMYFCSFVDICIERGKHVKKGAERKAKKGNKPKKRRVITKRKGRKRKWYKPLVESISLRHTLQTSLSEVKTTCLSS